MININLLNNTTDNVNTSEPNVNVKKFLNDTTNVIKNITTNNTNKINLTTLNNIKFIPNIKYIMSYEQLNVLSKMQISSIDYKNVIYKYELLAKTNKQFLDNKYEEDKSKDFDLPDGWKVTIL